MVEGYEGTKFIPLPYFMAFLHNLPSKPSFITFLLLFGSSFNTPTRMVHLSWAGTFFPSFDIGYGKVCCTLVRDLSTRACSLTRAHTQVESSRTEIKQAPPGFGSPHYIFLSLIPSFFPPFISWHLRSVMPSFLSLHLLSFLPSVLCFLTPSILAFVMPTSSNTHTILQGAFGRQ